MILSIELLIVLANSVMVLGGFLSPEAQIELFPSKLDSLLSQHSSQVQFQAKALELLSSLKLPETCLYSSLTESLIKKCTASSTVLDGQDKAAFATKLAVCEFKVANVDFPRQCRGDLGADWAVQKCIKALEGRPQWWTTWSNCLQSVSTVCQAVRGETERNHIIELHSNLTALYTMLHSQLQDSLGTTSGILHAHKRFAARIGGFFEGFMDSVLQETSAFTKSLLRNIEKHFSGIQDLVKKTQSQFEQVEVRNVAVLDKFKSVEEHIETGITKSKALHESSEENIRLANKLQETLKSLSVEDIENISKDIELVSTVIHKSARTVEGFEERTATIQRLFALMSGNYDDLASTFERLSVSLEVNRDMQTKNLRGVSATAADLNTQMNEILNALQNKTEAVILRLDHAEDRINGLGRNNRWVLWDAVSLFTIAYVLSGRKLGGVVLVVAGLTVGFILLLSFLPVAKLGSTTLPLLGAFQTSGNSTSWLHLVKQKLLG